MSETPIQTNAPDFDTAYQAFCNGDIATLESLAAGSDFPHGVDGFVGTYWLTNAISSGNLEAVRWVLGKDVEVNYIDDEGDSALNFALQIELHSRLIQPSVSDQAEVTALTICMIDLLYDAGADLNLRLTLDYTALHSAAAWSSTEVVRHLLALGADPSVMHRDYSTPTTPADVAKRKKRWEVHAVLCEAMGVAPSGQPI